jgi:hypothetical protein
MREETETPSHTSDSAASSHRPRVARQHFNPRGAARESHREEGATPTLRDLSPRPNPRTHPDLAPRATRPQGALNVRCKRLPVDPSGTRRRLIARRSGARIAHRDASSPVGRSTPANGGPLSEWTSSGAVAARAETAPSPRRSGSTYVATALRVAHEVRAAGLPEVAKCLQASSIPTQSASARRLTGPAPATHTAAVGDLAAAPRLPQKESSRAGDRASALPRFR